MGLEQAFRYLDLELREAAALGADRPAAQPAVVLCAPTRDSKSAHQLMQNTQQNNLAWGVGSRRRDCHFDDTPCLSLLKHPMKVQGGAIK